MFIAALFTIAMTWKQPRCLTDEWIKKLWYIYTMEYNSAKKKHILVSPNEVGELRAYCGQSEVSHKEENKYHILMHIYEI